MQLTTDATSQIFTINCNATVEAAATEMSVNNVGCLVVSDDEGKYAGIITERDIINRVIAPSRDLSATFVAEIMTSNVVCCSPQTPTSEARAIMAANEIRHLPVIENDVVVGMLSARDLMGRQLIEDRAAAEEVAMLSTCLKSIDINEVADIVVREVPKLFGAGKCVLCFHKDELSKKDYILVSRSQCGCPREGLSSVVNARQPYDDGELYYDSIPEMCRGLGGQSPRLVIPLGVLDKKASSSDEEGTYKGFLCMCDLSVSAATNRELLSYKARLAREILSSHLTNARLYQQARLTSLTDALTGVGSRKLLEDKLQAECARTRRYERPFSVAIIDLDNFKTINDILGHAAGDDTLVQLAATMKRLKRTPDVLTRYGGDEFVILLPETRAKDAIALMERLREKTHEIKLGENVPLTISCGIAQSKSDDANLPRDIMRRADLALYEAKSAGRDCVLIWNERMSRRPDASDLELDKIKILRRRIAGLSEQAETMFVQSICGLVQALEAKDFHAKKHSENVTHYTVAIARTMGVPAGKLEVIRRAAMIHDIGRIGVPDSILSKPGRLTPRERSIVEQHPLIAVRILEKMTFLEQEVELVRHHHEKWNGQGYPDGLSGSSIPLGARIMAVADTFDALTSTRSYRTSRSIGQAVTLLTDSAGYDFDQEAVGALVSWIDSVAKQLGKTLDQLTPDDLLNLRTPHNIDAAIS
ncbi:MAG: diguanylate cyclase [Sedimentisphaerales bacterium]|nr:diguanylate cyclase [Sedimentisphaerales bacterium]